ncbi:actin binding protein [Heterostelium album PN500]|uniref:Actin binding protein n=1 Tax=Heterostelium pallidum (strain ATCC 26659 / Pp 5 / PN500) TaxID=670386 RepID=D3BCH3_HETP5|nr:actin binding protein [Heterostelium album PN500]EFA80963.1 actin binding protein [Heterostelium album PN500]|eukprot:XP_020433081.1 actin binding protein [Heterostelium album PN500]
MICLIFKRVVSQPRKGNEKPKVFSLLSSTIGLPLILSGSWPCIIRSKEFRFCKSTLYWDKRHLILHGIEFGCYVLAEAWQRNSQSKAKQIVKKNSSSSSSRRRRLVMSSDTIQLKVRLVDKKVFKKFQFFPKKSVKEARLFIAKELEVDPEQYGLFLPPRDDQNGIWFRDDYPLDFYGLEGETDQKEAMLFSAKPEAALMEFVEFKKRYRPIKVTKGGDQYKTVMVDDTMNVADAITNILTQVPVSSAISESELFSMSEDEVEVLSGDMTIREQGYVGECTTGLLKTSKGEVNLYVKVPYCEGWIMRKRGGNIMKGIKNWNKRWYTLKKNKLIYHKAKGLGPEMGCIWMKTVQAVRPVRNVTDIPNKYAKSCFEIVTPARTYVMLANSATEMKKWVDILDFSRRMFAYETHFFGVASKGSKMSLVVKGNSANEESDASESEDESKKKKKEEAEAVAAAAAAEQEKQRLAKEEEEKAARQEEQERVEREAEEARRKAQEEEEQLKRQHEEFLEKQRQLELEKQKQLQDQLEEDRRLEELMQQMEMEQDERIKLKEEQERIEQERIESAKRLEEEQERVRKEVERLEQERQEAEKKEQERQEAERQEAERKEQERQERERESERIRLEAEVERQRLETERLEQERQMLLEQERIEQERLLAEQEENEADDLLQQLEQENQEEEQRQIAAKRLRSMQARLESVEAETPDLKYLLSEASLATPENLLVGWANYITSDCKLPSKPILNLQSVEANLDKYIHLLHKLEPESFTLRALDLTSNAEKAELIVQELQEFGVDTIKVEQLLSEDLDTQVNVLLTVYEEVGGNWEEEFQTQVVSKRLFATKYITHILQASPISQLLPSTPFEMLKSIMDGQILCYLINSIFPGTIDERVVKRNSQLSPKSNLNVAINCSRALGAKHESITKDSLASLSTSDLHNIVWEIVETCLLQAADPAKQRSLFHLMRAETRNSFRQLEREKVMLRWFNYHLRKICNRQINNFSDDMEDCENYAYLFEVIAPQLSRKDEILSESDWERRAEIVLDMASKLGCMPLLTPRDIVETENSKLNLLFVADLMRVSLALPAYNFSVDEHLVDQVAKSSEQSNNDQQLLEWINQMGLGVDASSLLEDFRDGTLFLKIFDKVLPAGTVDQKKLKIVPNSVFKKLELFNYTMEICHKFKLNVAGIAGTDLLNGDIRSNRAILNQVRRYLGDKVTIDVVTAHQKEALKWCNSKVDLESTKVKPIQSFKDQFLQDSLFLLELLEALSPKTIDRSYRLVTYYLLSTSSSKKSSDDASSVVSSSPALAAIAAPLEPKDYDYSVSVLVMGLAEAGKTTLQRQLDVMYGTKLLDPKYYQRLIYGNTIATLIRLIENADRVNISFSEDNTERVRRVLATPIELARNRLPRFPLRLGYDCKCLWEDPDMQTMFHYANCCPEYRTPGRTKYYMENMFRVFSPEFTPTRLDIISAYEQVDHPQHSTLTYRRLKMELTCAPTKPIQRKDWNAIAYHEPHYVFYVVSLKDYHTADELLNTSLIPTPTCTNHYHNNILLESLAALESFSNSEVFEKAHSIFLIFNTSETFVHKLKFFDLKHCFEDYNEGVDHKKAIDYITNKFTQILVEKNKPYQAYSINLLDQEDTRVKFDSVLDYIIPDAENRGLFESIPSSSLHPTSVLPHSSSIVVKPLNDNHIEISSAITSTTSTRANHTNGSVIGSSNNSISSALAASSLDDDTQSNASTSTASSFTNPDPIYQTTSSTQAESVIPPLSLSSPSTKKPKVKVDKKEQKAEKLREKEQLRLEKEQQRLEKEQQRLEKEQQNRPDKEQLRVEKEQQRLEKEQQRAEKEREKGAASELKRAEKEKQEKEKERIRLEKEQQLKDKKAAAAAAATATTTTNNNNVGTSKPKKKGKGLSVQSGFTSIQGRRKNMEDAHAVIDNLNEMFKQVPSNENCSYYAVYDGHGGVQTAQALEPIVHKCIVESSSFSSGNYEQSMKEGFDAADKLVIPVCEKSGSTGVAALIVGNTLYTANVGDSECVIARQNATSSSKSPVYDTQLLTYKHLANDEKEKIRITEMGGMIIFGRLFGSLAVARSFGDREYKEGEKKFVTSEPFTQVIDLTPKDHYIIMGCDGLWDKVSYEEATTMCSKLHKQGKNAKEISEALVNDSFDKGSTDNITVIVVILNWK